MNWMGGARRRLKAKNETKKQREFFQKRKRNGMQASALASYTSMPSLSHDLISFHLSQRNLISKSLESKPTKIIKNDLEKGTCNSLNLDSLETPLNRGTSLKGARIQNVQKKKVTPNDESQADFSPKMVYDSDQSSDSKVSENKPLTSSNENQFSSGNMYNPNFPTLNLNSNHRINGSNPFSYPSQCKSELNLSEIQYPEQTPDINEAFKKYVSVNRMRHSKQDYQEHFKSKFDHKKSLLQGVLENSFKSNIYNSSKIKGGSQRQTHKYKIIEKMNGLLERQKISNNPSKHKSELSYSQLSKNFFSSMPSKVSRTPECNSTNRKNSEIHQLSSICVEQQTRRSSLEELEKMIEDTSSKLCSPQDFPMSQVPQYFDTNYLEMSPLDSASSTSSPSMDVPLFLQQRRKRRSGNGLHSIRNCHMTSYKRIHTSLSNSESFGIEKEIVNRKRKIKILNTTVLTPCSMNDIDEESSASNAINSNRYQSKNREYAVSDNFSKSLFPSSFLRYFPTPYSLRKERNGDSKHTPRTFSSEINDSSSKILEKPEITLSNARRRLEYHNQNNKDEITMHKPEQPLQQKDAFTDNILAEMNYRFGINQKLKLDYKGTKVDAATSPFSLFKFPENDRPSRSSVHLIKPKGYLTSPEESCLHQEKSAPLCNSSITDNLTIINSADNTHEDVPNVLNSNGEKSTSSTPTNINLDNQQDSQDSFQNRADFNAEDLPATLPNTPTTSKCINHLSTVFRKNAHESNSFNHYDTKWDSMKLCVPSIPVQTQHEEIQNENMSGGYKSSLVVNGTSIPNSPSLNPNGLIAIQSSYGSINKLEHIDLYSENKSQELTHTPCSLIEMVQEYPNIRTEALKKQFQQNPFFINIDSYIKSKPNGEDKEDLSETEMNEESPISTPSRPSGIIQNSAEQCKEVKENSNVSTVKYTFMSDPTCSFYGSVGTQSASHHPQTMQNNVKQHKTVSEFSNSSMTECTSCGSPETRLLLLHSTAVENDDETNLNIQDVKSSRLEKCQTHFTEDLQALQNHENFQSENSQGSKVDCFILSKESAQYEDESSKETNSIYGMSYLKGNDHLNTLDLYKIKTNEPVIGNRVDKAIQTINAVTNAWSQVEKSIFKESFTQTVIDVTL